MGAHTDVEYRIILGVACTLLSGSYKFVSLLESHRE